MSRKELVKRELEQALRGKVYYHEGKMLPEGWVPNFAICSVSVGALSGLRRLRELKVDGHTIAKKRHEKSGTFLYKLILPEDNGQLKLLGA